MLETGVAAAATHNGSGQQAGAQQPPCSPERPHTTVPLCAQVSACCLLLLPASPAGDYGLVHGSLLCLQAWLRLSADASNTCRLSPGQLAASNPAILTCLFSLLGAPAAEAVTSERIEGLARELLCELLGPGTVGSNTQQERAAVEAAMAALLGMRDAALAQGPVGAGVARSVASIASALAQRDTEAVCGSGCGDGAAAANGNGAGLSNGHGGAAANPSVLPLAELMMQLVSRPERGVCEAAVDYFLMVNTLPSAQRPPQLVQPLFASLISPLLRGHACYGPNFTTWLEDLDDDEEDFYRWETGSSSTCCWVVVDGVGYLSCACAATVSAAAGFCALAGSCALLHRSHRCWGIMCSNIFVRAAGVLLVQVPGPGPDGAAGDSVPHDWPPVPEQHTGCHHVSKQLAAGGGCVLLPAGRRRARAQAQQQLGAAQRLQWPGRTGPAGAAAAAGVV